MEYKVEYHYSQFGKTKFIESVYLHFEKVLIWFSLNRKYHRLDVYVGRQESCEDKGKNIDISYPLMGLIEYLEHNQIFCNKDGQTFKKDILQLENIRSITISNLELCEKDCVVLRLFPKLRWIETKNCIICEDCNLGSLKCNYHDDSSLICNLVSFNGFGGEYFHLRKSKIMHQNKNVLHLNNICTYFDELQNMDYEHFFLTTVAPNMRKLEIKGKTELNDKDLLFISGFYNLESIKIDAVVSNYEQIQRLEKLRKIEWLFCTDEKELESTKEKRKDFATYFGNKSIEIQKNYLMTQRMAIQNQYQEFFHTLYVPRLERVKWQDKISSYDLEQIKDELETIAKMSRKERKELAREPKKEYNLFDSLNGLWFDKTPTLEDEDDCYLVNSNPNPFDPYDEKGRKKGIDYYVLKRKIHFEE